MGEFLDNLKKTVENGEFNSEAAKKIIELNNLADEKMKGIVREDEEEITSKLVEERLEKAGVKTVSEEDLSELNSKYEKEMAIMEKKQAIRDRLLVVIDIEKLVIESINDMTGFIKETEDLFSIESINYDPLFSELRAKLEEIKSKYSSFINN
jgi:hypothetical protein